MKFSMSSALATFRAPAFSPSLASCCLWPYQSSKPHDFIDEAPASQALVQVSPEVAGMDSERLDRVTQAMQAFVDEGKLSGAVTIASRDNKLVHFESVGYRDIEAQRLP